MSSDVLEKILDTIEEMRSLMILINQDKLTQIKASLLKTGTVKETIYNMCDETKTVDEIAQALGKDNSYVHSYLSILRREGLIRNVVKNGRQVYQQTF